MAFQLKDFVSIAASMVNRAKATQDKVTDFRIGSVARTLMESPAIEIEELYQRVFAGIVEAIPTSIFLSFDFTMITAAAARGSVKVLFLGPIEEEFTVPAGTVFSAPATGLKYLTAADTVVPVGATQVFITVECAEVGTVGNVGAGGISVCENYELPIGSTVTCEAIISGRDAETDDERKARFANYITSIARGTLESVRVAAASATVLNDGGAISEYVSRVGIEEAVGHATVYIYGSNGAPSDALIEKAQLIIDGWTDADGIYTPGYRPVGVNVAVESMIERVVNVNLLVSTFTDVPQTQAMIDEIETAITTIIESVVSGETLQMESISEAALTVAGVQQVVIQNIANIVCAQNEVLRLGQLTVTWNA